MKLKKTQIKNIVFFVFIALLIIPQTRQPIQVFLQKGLALISPSTINKEDRQKITTYNWRLEDVNGNQSNFSESQGKVVLINFWATWCPPCIAEMSNLNELYLDYNDKIDFYFVSNEDIETLQQFLNKNKYAFNVHSSITQYPSDFDVSSIPRTFLIDKEGNIVIDKTGAANWNSDKVRSLINQLLKE
ncbi:TlpA family protein disulfide reductase [Mangrovimonas spongiae]|uniref:TlpA family protein disulfide reductase n=1 Tax=Mangrovimonas spongiae TaxID=2494697 RepID=A0A428JYW7_9FLAO|nr:TlpA disulfide reductase family protein [Mangrovimonas spongiae]RSK39361.1 TlpA family protein disulfide reductase [Mangrovimonas spongiae]